MNIFNSIWNFVKKRRIHETKRKESIDELLARVWSRMEYKEHWCLDCDKQGFNVPMYIRRSVITCEPHKPIRDDVGFKCPKCNHTKHVGNPMTRKDAEHEIFLRGSPYLLTPTYSYMEQHDNEVKKRLEALGYGYF